MNTAWQTFLTEQGARIEQGEVRDFGQATEELAAALEGDVLCDLSHRALYLVSGTDSQTFLQGQLTNDIRQVNPSRHQLSGYCTPKGRMLALFRIFQRGDAYCLSCPMDVAEAAIKRLQMFVLRSQVGFKAAESLIGIGLSGPTSEQQLNHLLGALPAEPDEAVQHQEITVLRLAGKHPRFELYGEVEAIQTLWQKLAANSRAGGRAAWDLLAIHAAEPAVLLENREAFVPQMLNLQLINGVNFKKGCYTGQEVVARMHYLGKLKRRMYLAHTDIETPIAAATELESPQSASGQGAGRVVMAAPNPHGGQDLLAVAEVSVAESGQLFITDHSDRILQLLDMPYPFA